MCNDVWRDVYKDNHEELEIAAAVSDVDVIIGECEEDVDRHNCLV